MALENANTAIFVLGIGNTVMTDDGAGPKVVQKLAAEYRLPSHVDVMDGGTLGLDILPRLEGIQRLIIVDAVETGEAPGTCIRLTGDDIPTALETKVSPHQMGLKDLLSVSLLTQGYLPAEMVLIGVQPACIEMGTDLTPEVECRIDHMLSLVIEELQKWGVDVQPCDESS